MNLCFEPATFRVGGERSPDFRGCFGAAYILLSSYIFLTLKSIMCVWNDKSKGPLSFEKSYKYTVFIFIIFLIRVVLSSQFYRHLENTFQSIVYNE